MNIGSVDPNWEAEHWQALEMHNLLLDQETFGTHKREFYYQAKQTNQSSRTTFWSFYINFDALDKSSTQFDGTNFFLDGQHIKSQHNIQNLFTLLHLIPQDQRRIHSTTTNLSIN
jgi:hypothetical protein